MFLVKHKEHGNRHVASLDEARALEPQGWVKWPRTRDQKLGIVPKPPAPVEQPAVPAPPSEGVSSAVRNTLKLGKP